jgi:hypothetical protein
MRPPFSRASVVLLSILAWAGCGRRPEIRFVGNSLEDYWNDGRAARTIAREGWDFVVLQQGPADPRFPRVAVNASARLRVR